MSGLGGKSRRGRALGRPSLPAPKVGKTTPKHSKKRTRWVGH